ncbi:Hypothetical predicted protein [Pelobates cultripes]|uniref:Uncharacterized protein n=1 Tax=Pelobates cultripes TaxID=61616 RepID=A0AAD1VS19_PELCU|nr:Hypothetical predicted protein [Pelobates cultripes]
MINIHTHSITSVCTEYATSHGTQCHSHMATQPWDEKTWCSGHRKCSTWHLSHEMYTAPQYVVNMEPQPEDIHGIPTPGHTECGTPATHSTNNPPTLTEHQCIHVDNSFGLE